MDSTSLRAFDDLSAATGEAMWPGTVIISGVSYPCSVIRPRQRRGLSEYADEPEAVLLTVRILKSNLASAPVLQTPLTWDNARWKISTITGHEASEAKWTLTCDPNP